MKVSRSSIRAQLVVEASSERSWLRGGPPFLATRWRAGGAGAFPELASFLPWVWPAGQAEGEGLAARRSWEDQLLVALETVIASQLSRCLRCLLASLPHGLFCCFDVCTT